MVSEMAIDGKSASRAERQETRMQRLGARSERSGGRPSLLCSLSTVEVKRGEQGFQIIITGSEQNRKFTIGPDDVGPVLRDLETAIQVIRGQQ